MLLESAPGIGESGISDDFEFGFDGVDQVQFLMATNPGEPRKPLAKIASGGELSRTMLALKTSLQRSHEVPVLVFDEVDAGIGGRRQRWWARSCARWRDTLRCCA